MNPPIEYNIVVKDAAGNIAEIDWGNAPKWVEQHRALLDNAEILMLTPKPDYPDRHAVSVRLRQGQRWIVFSRVAGMVNTPLQIRLYAIGHQETTADGKTVKTLLWVYPDGDVEVAEKPHFVEVYLRYLRTVHQMGNRPTAG